MKLIAEVHKQEHCGDEAKVTLGNVQRIAGPYWKYYSDIQVTMPFSSLKSYPLGRSVMINIKPK